MHALAILLVTALEAFGTITGVDLADVDGDGGRDVLLYGSRPALGGGGGTDRFLAVFLKRDGRFKSAPDLDIRIPPDVVLAGTGDVLAAVPGAEVVLLTARAVWRLDLAAKSEAARWRRLADCPSLFFYPDPERVLPWDLVGDLDGDGAPEVLAPAAERALAVLRPAPDGADALTLTGRIELPDPSEAEGKARKNERGGGGDGGGGGGGGGRGGRRFSLEAGARGRGRMKLDLGRSQSGTLFRRSRAAPRPFPLDVDGDGRCEIVAGGRAFALAGGPGAIVSLPEKERSSLLADLNGDRALDHVGATTDVESLASKVLVRHGIAGKPGADLAEAPVVQELKIDGIVADLDLAEVDGDGRPDLCVVSYRLDLLGAVASGAGPESIDVTWSVFAALPDGLFSRRRALGGEVALKLAGEIAQTSALAAAVRFDADLDGDGRGEALFWDTSGRVRAHRVERETGLFASGGLELAKAPLLDLAAPEAEAVFPIDLGGGRHALAVRYRSRLEIHEP